MDNKGKRREVQQNLKIIIRQREKSKQQRQSVYAKDKMNFPPIIQSRQLIMQRAQHKQNKSLSLNKIPIESSQGPLANHQQYTNRNTNICRIQFKNEGPKIRELANETIKGNIIQTISHSPRRYYLSEDKKKDLLFLSSPNNAKNCTFQRIIQQLNMVKHSKKNTPSISKSQQYNPKQKFPPSIKPLLITKLANTPQQQGLIVSQIEQKSPFIKKTDKFIFLKKRVVKKQGLFEPWQQQNFFEEEQLMQNKI